jgi:hypothetical protein
MIVGCLLIGIVAGLLSFCTAFILGASFWSALLLYCVVGAACALLLPLAVVVARAVIAPIISTQK